MVGRSKSSPPSLLLSGYGVWVGDNISCNKTKYCLKDYCQRMNTSPLSNTAGTITVGKVHVPPQKYHQSEFEFPDENTLEEYRWRTNDDAGLSTIGSFVNFGAPILCMCVH